MRRVWLTLAATFALGCESPSPPPDGPQLPENTCPDCVTDPPIHANSALTPVIGGTLAITADGATAVVADPESHQIFVVDLPGRRVRATLAVPGAEPGRVVLSDRAAYVALRRGGVVVVDLENGAEAARFDTCAAPRGLALDGDRLHVACAGGDLLTFAASEGRLARRVHLAPDLRDVIVTGDRLLVSTFRRAEVLVVDGETVIDRWRPRSERPEDGARVTTAPTVAWRMIAAGDGRVALLHQRSQTSRVVVEREGGYGAGDGRCSRAIVAPALTVFGADGAIVQDAAFNGITLGVDLSVHGDRFLVAAAGDRALQPFERRLDDAHLGCFRGRAVPAGETGTDQYTAVAFDAAGNGWALSRAPLALVRTDGARVALAQGTIDTGHALFHENAGRGIACASCHPEGSDDGHTWLFEGFGLRRTQNLRGGLKGSEPFHWEGDLADIEALVAEVMVRRMGHDPLSDAQTRRLLDWMDAQPAEVTDAAVDPAAAARGAELFADPAVGCASCHSVDGARDPGTYDVGTGGYFQVPTLAGLAHRGPFMHDGCAPTLAARFEPACGGGDAHGRTSQLSTAEIADLVAFLQTL